ncbi:MAG: hypothetical protein WAV73_01365 [Candidatus Moraniibacteriota bacterium]
MIELELTYLAKYIPDGLLNCPSKKIIDRYLPFESSHPVLRLRKSGEKMELTKKRPIDDIDASRQLEETILLDIDEFETLVKLPAQIVAKTRYYYSCEGNAFEVDVFEGDLLGLVLVDIEFENVAEKEKFKMPEFCLVDMTQDKMIAGGMLAGKKYADIKNYFEQLGYVAL